MTRVSIDRYEVSTEKVAIKQPALIHTIKVLQLKGYTIMAIADILCMDAIDIITLPNVAAAHTVIEQK